MMRPLLVAGLLGVAGSSVAAPLFTEVAGSAGLDFVHRNGMAGELLFTEMMGGGGVLFDYDNDGDLDLFAVQGGSLQGGAAPADAGDRLYRNDSTPGADGRMVLRFTDVSAQAGIRRSGYGIGATAGDIDNDGWIDLYVTEYGPNALLRNNGDGTFSNLTEASGAAEPRWSSSAAFVDYDQDGLLDLFVANYVAYSADKNPRCYARSSRRDYCGPASFTPERDRLFHNLGGGRFEDATPRALGPHAPGAGLGVVAADFNGDGRPDIYVANDGLPNHLWLNQGNGRFVEDGLMAGAAVNREGKSEASMGVDAGDFDNDGDQDLFMTHLTGETNTLFRNDGTGLFEDRTLEFGLALPSLPFTAFGTAWLDYDNDGWLDLLVVNGAVRIIESLAAAGDPYPLGQTKQLFHNIQGKSFEEATAQGGPAFALPEVSRGAAFGDIDNDGDVDAVVFNSNGPIRLLRNEAGQEANWLGLRLLTADGRRDALGAQVELRLPGGAVRVRRARADGSYCSGNDPRVLFGLGQLSAPPVLAVTWPDGRREQFAGVPAGRYTPLTQGTGKGLDDAGAAP